MKSYKNRINRLKTKLKNKSFQTHIFSKLIIDNDAPSHFYLDGPKENNRFTLYEFNNNGKMGNVLYTEIGVNFMCKRNNLFYAIDVLSGKIFIFKRRK